jgi:nicotinic acetylcholine receptor
LIFEKKKDQLCKLKFGSWTYDAAQVNLTKRRDNVDMTNYIRSGEWHIVHINIKRNDVTYPCCPGIYYPDVTIYGKKKNINDILINKINLVHIRRRVLYYLFNIIFPCIWLSILSLLGFWLPPDSGEKITLGITVLLAFSVFMLLIAESMPATSEMVPLIEIYLTIVMALTSLSIVLTVYVLQLHHSGPVVIPIPHSFKYSLVRHIAPVIGMKDIVRIYAEEHHLIETDEVYRIFAKPKPKSMDSPLINNNKKSNEEKKKKKYRQGMNIFSFRPLDSIV